MTAGLVRNAQHQYSWDGSPWVPGVTTVIKALDKSGPLIGWAQKETAAAAVRNVDFVAEHVQKHRMPDPLCAACTSAGFTWDGPADAAVKWLKRMPGYKRDKSADLGSRVHALAEALARKQPVTVEPDEAPFIESYMRWLADRKPKFKNVEYMVWSERNQYGGTADAAAWLDGDLYLLDYKTGANVYPETALQLAGLHFADWAGKPGDPKPYGKPNATKFGVVHIRPEKTELVPFEVTSRELEAFLACRRLLSWVTERAPIVKGSVELVEAA